MSNVAILTPSYNCEHYVEDTFKSLMAQGDETLKRVDRLILSDDCSTDRTIEVARNCWKGPIPLEVYENEENRGEYRQVNAAVARLPEHIEWFVIMQADNVAKEGWLECLLDRIEAADEKIGTICTSWDDWPEDGSIIPGDDKDPPTPNRTPGTPEFVAKTLIRGTWWHISSCALRVKTYRDIGGLPPGFRLKGDWDFLIRLQKCGWDIEYIPRTLMKYRVNPVGSSSLSFLKHSDVTETLTVARRHDHVLGIGGIYKLHMMQWTFLAKRFGAGLVRGNFRRAFATIPMSFFVLGDLLQALHRHFLGQRRFDWVSSSDPRAQPHLHILSNQMGKFYSLPATRDAYQAMIDDEGSAQPRTEGSLRKAVHDAKPSSVLEVGCGSGRIYERLRNEGYEGEYTGVEMAPEVIADNIKRFPEATWIVGSGYDLPVEDESKDVVFSYYVLEHCAYPERYMTNLLKTVKPGGSLILTCPNPPATGIFPSQRLGWSEHSAGEHFRTGRILHAIVAFYDSRWRLPRALRNARRKVGPFPVNLNPKCLDPSVVIRPDVDAIYASSREELSEWAEAQGLEVLFPGGTDGILEANVLIQMKKPASSAARKEPEKTAATAS